MIRRGAAFGVVVVAGCLTALPGLAWARPAEPPTQTAAEEATTSTATAPADDSADTPWAALLAAGGALAALALVSLGMAGGFTRRRGRARTSPDVVPSAVSEPVTPAGPPPPPAPAPPPLVQLGAVRWRPDPELGAFVAEAGVEGAEPAEVARSAGVRWRGASPPPRRAAIVSAHAALLEALRDDGWSLGEPARGRRWYEWRLSRGDGD